MDFGTPFAPWPPAFRGQAAAATSLAEQAIKGNPGAASVIRHDLCTPPLTPAEEVGSTQFLFGVGIGAASAMSLSPMPGELPSEALCDFGFDLPALKRKTCEASALDHADLALGDFDVPWPGPDGDHDAKRPHLSVMTPPAETEVRLANTELWLRFHRHTTEMVLTRKGRCLFPPPKFHVRNLAPQALYSIVLEVAPMDQERWKFFAERRNWRSLGPIDEPGAPQMYTHPSSPQLGEGWLKSDVVSFEHMKVTNNAALAEDACVLRSAQKYRLRLFVVRHDELTMEPQQVDVTDFAETEFVAVTVYQNDAIRDLKKQFNPRAFK